MNTIKQNIKKVARPIYHKVVPEKIRTRRAARLNQMRTMMRSLNIILRFQFWYLFIMYWTDILFLVLSLYLIRYIQIGSFVWLMTVLHGIV